VTRQVSSWPGAQRPVCGGANRETRPQPDRAAVDQFFGRNRASIDPHCFFNQPHWIRIVFSIASRVWHCIFIVFSMRRRQSCLYLSCFFRADGSPWPGIVYLLFFTMSRRQPAQFSVLRRAGGKIGQKERKNGQSSGNTAENGNLSDLSDLSANGEMRGDLRRCAARRQCARRAPFAPS
jgi:hypothetical protein